MIIKNVYCLSFKSLCHKTLPYLHKCVISAGSSHESSPVSTPLIERKNPAGTEMPSSTQVVRGLSKALPKDVLTSVNQFQRKQKGTIDVWWLYDDGGRFYCVYCYFTYFDIKWKFSCRRPKKSFFSNFFFSRIGRKFLASCFLHNIYYHLKKIKKNNRVSILSAEISVFLYTKTRLIT